MLFTIIRAFGSLVGSSWSREYHEMWFCLPYLTMYLPDFACCLHAVFRPTYRLAIHGHRAYASTIIVMLELTGIELISLSGFIRVICSDGDRKLHYLEIARWKW